jgi:hypothetical protein
LIWRVNGNSLFFDISTEVGALKRTNTHVATLLRSSSSRVVSVLNIEDGDSSGVTVVECYNGNITEKRAYHHRVAGARL